MEKKMLLYPIILNSYNTSVRCSSLAKIHFSIGTKDNSVIMVVPMTRQTINDITLCPICFNNRDEPTMGDVYFTFMCCNACQWWIKAICNQLKRPVFPLIDFPVSICYASISDEHGTFFCKINIDWRR